MPTPRLLGTAGAILALATAAALAVPISTSASPGAAPGGPSAQGDARGTWQVTKVDRQTWKVTWRSPNRLPVTSDRPTIVDGGEALGVPTIAPDGRTVQVTVRSQTAPTPADLDVVLSGDRLDVAGEDLSAAAAASDTAPARSLLADDPGVPGPYDFVSSDYELDPVKIPGMAQPIEMVGHVVEPDPSAATGPRPLVLFLHGRHSYCYNPSGGPDDYHWPCRAPMKEIPGQLGYDYIQRLLASQGYATVSIRVNGINAQDYAFADGGASARATIVRRHLSYWVSQAAAHQVDMSEVVLVGHSRGGEGVNRATLQIPLSAPYKIAGQVLIAPTDFGTQTAPYVPTVTLLPYCDGDVIDLQGQKFTDTGRDLATDDTSLKSSVMVLGANHNFFNTEWTPGISEAPSWDDWFGNKDAPCGRASAERLRPVEQRSVGKAYVAGAVALFTRDAEQYLPLFDGSATQLASTGDAVVLSHALGGGRQLRRPGLSTGLSLPEGAETQFCTGMTQSRGPHRFCGRAPSLSDYQTPHWPGSYQHVPTRRAFEMSWSAADQRGGMVFDNPLNLSGGRLLDLRTIVDPTMGDVQVHVRLTDTSGQQADVVPDNDGALPALLRGPGLSKRWAQTLVVDPSAAGGVDLTRINKVELVGDSADGRVWVLDVAAVSGGLAAVPDKRMPVVSLSNVTVDEGDGPTGTARVPFTVVGDLTERGSFTVFVAGDRGILDRGSITVDLAPGQTHGSIPIDFLADKVDDFDASQTYLVASAGHGVMTNRYLGILTVRDDDPAPAVTVTPVAKTVTEGSDAVWKVSLSSRVDYTVEVFASPCSGAVPGPRLTRGDVSSSWLRHHSSGKGGPSTPLDRADVYVFEGIRSGSRSLDLRIPIARDGAREPRESLSLEIQVGDKSFVKTIYVAASN